MKVKRVFRYDESQKVFRLFRIVWNGKTKPVGKDYSCQLYFAFKPKIYELIRNDDGFEFVALGIRFSYRKSYGGIFT